MNILKIIIRDIPPTLKTLKRIFRLPQYIFIALFSSSAILVISIWLPNLGLVKNVILSNTIATSDKMLFLWNSLGAIQTNFTLFSASLLISVSILVGLNMSMMVYYFKQRIAFQKSSGTGIAGLFLGFIGVGCASCGSILLSSIIGVGAAASFIGFLPFKGLEFSFLSIAILIFSFYITAKKASDPLVCKI